MRRRGRVALAVVLLLVAAVLVAAPSSPASAHTERRVWWCLSHHEGYPAHNWQTNTGNGYYGGLQFSLSTWRYYGGRQFAEYPHRATWREQRTVGRRTAWHGWRGRAPQRGYRAWPNTWWRCR